MCHHLEERTREFAERKEEEALEDEVEPERDEPPIRTTANADD